MRVIRCPQCAVPLPWTAHYCAKCGCTVNPQDAASYNDDSTVRINQPVKWERHLPSAPLLNNDLIAQQRIEEWLSDDEGDYDEEMDRRATWQKVVTHKTPTVISSSPASAVIVADVPASSGTLISSVSLASPPDTPSPTVSARHVLTAPLFGQGPPPGRNKRQFSLWPRLSGWITVMIIVGMLFAGVFGIFNSLGHGLQKNSSDTMSLQVSPTSVATGGTITLSGSHFTPKGEIGLYRDTTIPLLDTDGRHIIHADASGSFRDTVRAGDWGTGQHSIIAEDARLHKSESFNITLKDNGQSGLPARLEISVNLLDLGSGDQTTNASQTIQLLNTGGGQITWQATSTQPWLLVSPSNGIFESGQSVILAGDRSNLQGGTHTASVIFKSANAGTVTLPVQMEVTPLQVGHEAALQVTPAVLNFTAIDGGTGPTGQVLTISNPGVQTLNWGASASTTDGGNWLLLSSSSGQVTGGNSQPVIVSINNSLMLPGVYNGSITFSSQGSQPVVNNQQTVYITVTISPQCSIQVMPGALTFAAVFLQSAPAAKIISVGTNQGCSTPLAWSITATTSNGGSWLSVNAGSGNTPSSPAVSVAINGLQPGTYNGQLVFSSSAGTQTVPVTLVMGQPTTPVLTSSAAVLNVNGTSGQPAPSPSAIVLSNTGGGTLSWQATATTASGGAWLSVAPAQGTLGLQQVTNLAVTAVALQGMAPGTYNGTITLSGTDGAGNTAAGSPQTIPVTFTVQAPCTIAASVSALTFQGVIGQPASATQPVTISASGACANTLDWTATTATTPAGGTWLITKPAQGTVTTSTSSSTAVGVALTGLTSGTYAGTLTISAIDSVTQQPVGTPQTVAITLNVQPPCTLQTPSVTSETFSSEASQNPASQTFTIGVTGACNGTAKVTPGVTTSSGGSWLSVSPASKRVASGATATFTVNVTAVGLAPGTYKGSISLAAVNGGIAITGSPQQINVTLTVLAPPALTATPGSLTFSQATGPGTQSITISNTGGEPLNWTAALGNNAPAYVTISSASSGTLAPGATAMVAVTVDTTGLPGGTGASASVTINATDPLTGLAVSGSPATAAISVSVPASSMQLSTNSLTFTTTAGTNPANQTITLTNGGGDGLTWNVGTPSQPWLSITPSSGSEAAGAIATLTFSVDVTGLSAGTTYTATVTITPSTGAAQTVTATLTVN